MENSLALGETFTLPRSTLDSYGLGLSKRYLSFGQKVRGPGRNFHRETCGQHGHQGVEWIHREVGGCGGGKGQTYTRSISYKSRFFGIVILGENVKTSRSLTNAVTRLAALGKSMQNIVR